MAMIAATAQEGMDGVHHAHHARSKGLHGAHSQDGGRLGEERHKPGDLRAGSELAPVVPSGSSGEDGADGAGEPKPAVHFTVRQQLYLLLEDPDSSLRARVCSHFILYTIVASIACFVLETVPSLRDAYVFKVVEPTTTIIFTLEYVARFLVCDAFPPTCYGHQSKWDFIRNPLNILDLLAIAPFYLEVAAAELMKSAKPLRVLRSVRLIRCFRIFKLSKYSLGMTIMVDSVVNSFQPLVILCFFLLIGVVLTSSLMYYAERTDCPDVAAKIANNTFEEYRKECIDLDTGWTRAGELCCNEHGSGQDFVSIRGSFWWAVVTMTTVGYGDVVPRTLLGRLVGCLAMISGIVLISLPVAIVGSKFQMAYESIEHEKQRILNLDESEREALMESKMGANQVDLDLLAAVEGEKDDVAKEFLTKRVSVNAGQAAGFGGIDPERAAQAAQQHGEHHPSHLANLRTRLKSLEQKEKLSDKALDELYLLMEMFDHIERVEKQLKREKERDAALDASIRKEFASLARAYDLSVREKGLH